MRISENWLREFCNPSLSCAEMAEQLTMGGLEIESLESPSINYDKMVVAHVTETQKHPDADKLTVCRIDAGDGELLQVICGASNVRKDLKVVLAKVGASFPKLTIKKAKLRGVDSNGMLCSEVELGLRDEAPGIMELPSDAPVGMPVADYLKLDDTVIDISITPNRGDCVSVLGIARELSALNDIALTVPEVTTTTSSNASNLTVTIDADAACSSYRLREISGIDNTLPSPIWMQQRLRQSGLRPINAVVDILNYVMLELGQPMHAFDRGKLGNEITIRFAKEGESVVLLDSSEVALSPNELVIANDTEVLALAGVMGGLSSAVETATTRIALESAHFSPDAIAGCVRRLGKHSDSSYRFERGVDPVLPLTALNRATDLILELLGGVLDASIEQGESSFSPKQIELRHHKLNALLGVEIDKATIKDSLTRLNMQVTETDSGWQVVPPSYRFDMAIEQDLIEEVVRLYGYDKIPEIPCVSRAVVGSNLTESTLQRQARLRMTDLGYSEVITYSFVDHKRQSLLLGELTPVHVDNPISSEMGVMRMSLWPGLIQAVSYNQKRQQERVRLFEVGKSFRKEGDTLLQYNQLSGIASGSVYPEQWSKKAEEVDFYDVKADMLSVLEQFVPEENVTLKPVSSVPALHPGQAAEILVDGQFCGHIGVIHPQLMKKLGLKHKVVLFELNTDGLMQAKSRAYQAVSKFPSVRRDLAFLVDVGVSAGELLAHARQALKSCSVLVQLFDLYEGENTPSDKKSLAISFTFQAIDETLTDEAVAKRMEKVLNSLVGSYGVELRE
jgi:phenylalanyl-tRNA synthetase beta chain